MTAAPSIEIAHVTALEDRRVAVVKGFLREHNYRSNPDFMKKVDTPGLTRPLVALASGSSEETLGGLIAETQLRWLRIELLAVHPNHRRTGIGSRLLATAESEARARGCCYAFLETMVYHAPLFYERNGYGRVCTLTDWDSDGHDKYVYTKRL